MSQLKETCSLLDDTLLEYFETLGAVYQKQEQLDSCMKDGYLCMAKARYSMGANSVGALQYDTENMEASAVVSISDDEEIEAIYPVFSLKRDGEQKESPQEEDSGVGLRKRNVKKDDDKDIDEVAESVKEMSVEDKKSSSPAKRRSPKKDSLKWFGVLVPQALKDSQTKFQEAVEISCDLATLKVKLNSLQSHYSQLMQEKQDILNSVSLFAE